MDSPPGKEVKNKRPKSDPESAWGIEWPPVNFAELAERLVRASTGRNFAAIWEVLTYLDPAHVDLFVYIRAPNGHLSIVGNFRTLYRPEGPHAIQREPSIAQIAS